MTVAMGFPVDYKLPPQHHKAVHLLGNAVACDAISALIEQI